MGKFLGFLGRHKIAVMLSAIFVGGPILMIMPPLVLLMVIIWGWVCLSECGKK